MANIFQDIVDQFKSLGSLASAQATARQSKQQAEEVEGKLRKKFSPLSPVVPAQQPQSTNAFADVPARIDIKSSTPRTFKTQGELKIPENVFSDLSVKTTTPAIARDETGKPLPASPIDKAVEIAEKGAGFIKSAVIEAPVRAGVSVGLDIIGAGKAEAIPETPFQKFFLGEEPVESVSARIQKFPERLKEFGEAFGFEPDVEGAKAFAPFFIPLLTAFDIIPGLPKKKLAERLAKETSEAAIETTLKKEVKNITEDEAKTLAKQFAPITNKDAIQKELSEFAKKKAGIAAEPAVAKEAVKEIVPTAREAEPVIGMREPFEGLPREVIAKAKARTEITVKEAIELAESLDKQGFGVDASRRRFRDELGRGAVLGESFRDPKVGTPDRIIFRPSKTNPTKGMLSITLKAIPDESFAKPPKRVELPKGKVEAERAAEGARIPPVPPTAKEVVEKVRGEGPERRFAAAVRESPETKPPLKAELEARDLTYKPLPNEQIVKEAKEMVGKSADEAEAFILKGEEASPSQVATSIELIRHHQNVGNYEKAADIAETIAEKLTRAGQAVQAAKLYIHLEPEAILVRAQKLIQKINAKKFRWQKDLKLTPETTKQITDLAKAMKEATDPALKVEFAEELESVLRNIPRSGVLRKISMAQTLAQLLNPKTLLARNPLGNEIFYRLERINKYITSPIDWARSKLTGGERTVTFHTVNQGEFWKNWIKGLKAGWKGITPGGLGTQFEIYAPAFQGKYNPFTYLEKTLGASLRSFDYAAYKRAVNETLGELGWLRAKNEGLSGQALKDAAKKYANEASDEAVKIADQYGRYITFQDDNVISRVLMSTKRGLNLGQDFGVGDLVIKYPKTPGALLMRALEYSPAGFLRSSYLAALPILKAGKKADVREIEISLARAITGTLGLTGLGYYLADKGIITGEPDPNKKVTGLERAIGAGRYQINLSAFQRWVLSGFSDDSIQEGDRFYTYDWAQPIAVALSLGANMNEAVERGEQKAEKRGPLAGVPGTVESSISGAVETIAEQPLLTGLRTLFGGENVVQSALRTIESMPSSFTPTIVNQFRQVVDPVQRETYDPSILTRSINRVKSRLPIFSEELPKRHDVFGREVPALENPNLFNIFINPGFISTYKPTPAAQVVLQIYNETGETKQLPRVAPRYLVFQGKRVNLSGEQVSTFQERIGKATDILFTGLAKNPKFQKMSNDQKADALNYVLGKIYGKERFLILTPEQRSELVKSMDPDAQKSFAKELLSALK